MRGTQVDSLLVRPQTEGFLAQEALQVYLTRSFWSRPLRHAILGRFGGRFAQPACFQGVIPDLGDTQLSSTPCLDTAANSCLKACTITSSSAPEKKFCLGLCHPALYNSAVPTPRHCLKHQELLFPRVPMEFTVSSLLTCSPISKHIFRSSTVLQ